jgi:glucose/mannose transport system substrate-binding protein
MDSWLFPSGNPAPEGAKEWLSYVGSKEAQKRFNMEKGSIPPRGDVDMSSFPAFQQKQYDDFTSSDSQPPSVAHGLAVTATPKSNLESALSDEFDYSSGSVEATAEAFISATSS